MTRALPDDREKALEAIADGWGREATAAHPLCTCLTDVKVFAGDGQTKTVRLPTTDSRKDCPVHGGTR